jgi:hypothetical protein
VLRGSLDDVPAVVAVGDLFVATWARQVIWYEVLELVTHTHVLVRLHSRIFKQGEYDVIRLDALEARVTRGLFERAQAHGFRTVRQSN